MMKTSNIFKTSTPTFIKSVKIFTDYHTNCDTFKITNEKLLKVKTCLRIKKVCYFM